MKLVIALCGLLAASHAYADDVDAMLDAAAQRHGVPREIVHAVAHVESTKRCGLMDGPHRGIMQVSRGAAREVGMDWPFHSCAEEIEAGVRYLRLAVDKGGAGCNGVTLYNTGLNAHPHCSSYGRRVMAAARSYL